MNQFDERFENAFGKVSFVVNRFILDHMTRITRELEMDLESAHLWGVLANLNVMHMMAPGSAFSGQPVVDERLALEFKWVRLSDIAQVTGMPRETVRRKLNALEARGKVQRNADGMWALKITGIDSQTRAFTKETAMRCLRAAKEMEALLSDAKPWSESERNQS